MFHIATLADWFGVGLIEGIRASERCGATGVQIYAAGELDPRTIGAEELARVALAQLAARRVEAARTTGVAGPEIGEDGPVPVVLGLERGLRAGENRG